MLGKKLNNFILIFVCVFFSGTIIDSICLFRIKYFIDFTIECFICKYFSVLTMMEIIVRENIMVTLKK